MAKTDLLKQAIADANAVKETALANAKIALQEAFAPRIQSMLSAKLSEELEDEEMPADDTMMDDEAGMADDAAMDDMGNAPEEVGVGLDFDMDGEYDLTGNLGAVEDEEMPADDEMSDDEMNGEYAEDDDLELESIIRELEEDLDGEIEAPEAEDVHEGYDENEDGEEMTEDIDSIIEAILREEDLDVTSDVAADDEHGDVVTELAEKEEELKEAYKTVKKLTSIINEVNLLNAKLLYTNKLFRNFELNESQKNESD